MSADDSVADKIGEDSNGIEAVHAADLNNVVVAKSSIDLRQDEARAMVHVQPDDLVGGQQLPRHLMQTAEFGLVHLQQGLLAALEVCARLLVMRVHFEHFLYELEGPTEVAEAEKFPRACEDQRRFIDLSRLQCQGSCRRKGGRDWCNVRRLSGWACDRRRRRRCNRRPLQQRFKGVGADVASGVDDDGDPRPLVGIPG